MDIPVENMNTRISKLTLTENSMAENDKKVTFYTGRVIEFWDSDVSAGFNG